MTAVDLGRRDTTFYEEAEDTGGVNTIIELTKADRVKRMVYHLIPIIRTPHGAESLVRGAVPLPLVFPRLPLWLCLSRTVSAVAHGQAVFWCMCTCVCVHASAGY